MFGNVFHCKTVFALRLAAGLEEAPLVVVKILRNVRGVILHMESGVLDDMDILAELTQGLDKHELSYTVCETTDNTPVVVRFEKANEEDCSMALIISGNKLEIHRVIGSGEIKQSFEPEQIDESFFEMLKDHHDTIKSLIKMRDRLTKHK